MLDFLNYFFAKIYSISGLSNLTFYSVLYFLSIVLLVFLIELAFIGWNRSSFKKILKFDKSARTDIIFCLLEMFNLFNILAFFLSFGICYFLVGQIQKAFNFNLILHIDNLTMQFIIVFLISDLKEYFKHFIFHKVGPLWALHEFHHSASNFTILTGYRFHFLQTSFGMFFDVIPYVILGVPLQTFFAIKILSQIHGLLVHSNFENSWGFVGKYILVSPAAHRIHHSTEKKHFDKNYGGTFIFWDRIFGTYYPTGEKIIIGLPDNQYNKNTLFHDVWLSMNRSFHSLVKCLHKN